MIKRWAVIALGVTVFLWPSVALADTQDFTIPTFEADYYLSKSADGQSHLKVTEKIVADFPSSDQNHGILRALPVIYLGHNIHLTVGSVTDGAGNIWSYSTSPDNNNLVLKIGDANVYVHGLQTYVISYEQDYVTTKTNGYDGFFWDINGDQWSQTFGAVTARIHLEGDLAASMDATHNRCFTGANGSTEQACTVSVTGNVVTVVATRQLEANETLTAEVGFKDGTFATYKTPAGEAALADLMLAAALLLPIAVFIYAWRRWSKYGRDPKGRGGVIAEYLPPKDLSVLGSSAVWSQTFVPKALSAQIIDLAVRHYLKIYEIEKKVLFAKSTQYEVEVVKPLDGLRTEELSTLTILFDSPAVGSRVNLSTLANKLYKEANDLGRRVGQQVVDAGYFVKDPSRARLPMMILGGVTLLGAIVPPIAVTGALPGSGTALLAALALSAGLAVSGIVFLVFGYLMAARTEKGVEMKEYLAGLKYYMQVAEAERLKILQSPHGELTDKVDVGDGSQLVKLYERVLPYAVLFGIEKDWAKEMAPLYEAAGGSPDWYSGSGVFNAMVFANAMNGFTAASGASFSAPSSSSGGGSAGGGGGGGGGGGW